jgi:hypothetical protein
MTRLTKMFVAATVVVVGVGFTAQSASAAPPSVIVHPTFRPFPTHGQIHHRPLPFPNPHRPHDHDYLVQYRPSVFGGWRTYGKFETRHGAEVAQRRLEWQGIPTRVIRLHDYSEPPHRW